MKNYNDVVEKKGKKLSYIKKYKKGDCKDEKKEKEGL